MSKLIQECEAAKNAYHEALAALEVARRSYEDGPGRRLAELQKNTEGVKRAIGEHQQARQVAKATLAGAMRATIGQTSKEAKDALAVRRNAEDMLEQYQVLANELDFETIEARIAASSAARLYIAAYDHAARCWAELNAYSLLVDCGERIARAIVVRRSAGSDSGLVSQESHCRDFIVKILDRLASELEANESPFTADIGVVDLGLLARADILSPAEGSRMLARKQTSAVSLEHVA